MNKRQAKKQAKLIDYCYGIMSPNIDWKTPRKFNKEYERYITLCKFTTNSKPCLYAEGVEDEWECTCYNQCDCKYQECDYNTYSSTDGFKEINVVSCTKRIRRKVNL